MSKAKLSALLVIIGLLIVVGLVLIVVSLRLLLSTASIAVPSIQTGGGPTPGPLSSTAGPTASPIQPGSGFPVDTPDFAAFATAFCCDDGTPRVMTPSSGQVAYMTEVAQTQAADAATMAATITIIPLGQFLTPSGEWTTYTDPNFGYSFEYPSNWFVSNNGSSTVVNNLSPGMPPKDTSSRLNIWIGPEEDFANYGSLESCLAAYLAEPEHAVPPDWIISQTSRTLPSGYEVLEMKQKGEFTPGALIIFLTNGTQLYEMHVVDMRSHHIAVAEHVVNSFIIPE
ncbi:MAG: hypothetical protein JXB07_04940 [Anaerolineae bacterium]|nr:hypothetical protein [Anaerolineae bacterium]